MKEYIERDAAIEFVKSLVDTMSVCTSIDECLGMKSMKSRALGALHDVPAADVVEVKHGRWIDKSFKGIFYSARIVECEHCHNTLDLDGVNAGRGDANYCPNCGAKMDEVGNGRV